MKVKKLSLWLICFTILFTFTINALATDEAGAFTHPEVGEFMTIHVDNHLADFEIYGFTYYRLIPYEEPYRGLNVNALELINEKNASFEVAMEKLLDCVDGKMEGYPPIVSFSYTGYALQFEKQLKALDRADQIKALRILSGMDGAQGFQDLKNLPGFENTDISNMVESHQDYFVRINGVRYPYRVMMFFFEEEDWYEYYNERYHFIQVEGEWKLIRIAKEYSDEYSQRSKYIHGFEGTDLALVADTNFEALRGTTWGMSIQQASTLLKAQANEDEIVFEKDQLYRVPAKSSYQFGENGLESITYTFDGLQRYYSIFVSLYIRYFDPIEIDENRTITWCQNDMNITLSYDEAAPTLTLSPAE